MQNARIPEWLRRPAALGDNVARIKKVLRHGQLSSVCEEARCPNIAECFAKGTATFMILGDVCTRHCPFCSITSGTPTFSPSSFPGEVSELVNTVISLQLKHVVITSVTRDDLPDGGAIEFALAISSLREKLPNVSVEVLIPDFKGDIENLAIVVNAAPDILNHNLETVPRLYKKVRPGAKYNRSLELLSSAKAISPNQTTKTGIMLGLGESREEVLELMHSAAEHGVDIFTAGQYMQPTKKHLAVERYLQLDEFDWYKEKAKAIGFSHYAIGPLVRSSYNAEFHANQLQEGTQASTVSPKSQHLRVLR